MTLKLNDTVMTPNGPGTFQGRWYGNGLQMAGVAHKPDAEINVDKTQFCYYAFGIWKLCGYLMNEVIEAK